MQSFILPANGAATPKSIERKRKMAEAMLANGIETSPIASPWQGAARMAQALVGGLGSRKADKQEAEGSMAAKEALIKALNGGDKASVIDAASNPFMSNAGMELIGSQWDRMNPKPTNEITNFEYGLKNPDFNKSNGLFDSKSVEGQALNYLIQTQTLTKDQAAQIAAGKSITGSDGSTLFLTPSDIVQAAQQKLGAGSSPGQPQAIPQAGTPLGPPKKTESEIKGEAIQSGIGSSVSTIMEGGTPEKPYPILDELATLQNSAGANLPGGRAVMTGKAQKGFDALKNIAQNYIYALSGQQAPEQEVMRAMSSVMPSPIDGPEAIAGKQARLADMIATINSRAQGPAGKTQQPIPPPMQQGIPDVSTMSDEDLQAIINGP